MSRWWGIAGMGVWAACHATPGEPALWPGAQGPLPGTEVVRIAPRIMTAGESFTAQRPLVFEVHIPQGMVIPGRGLPAVALDGTSGAYNVEGRPDDVVLRLEVPVVPTARPDEDGVTGQATTLSGPLYCLIDDPDCPWSPHDEGRWRAYRIRQTGGPPLVQELQLGTPVAAPYSSIVPSWRFVSVWLAEDDLPLDAHDRIAFTYVGRAPRAATDWWTHSGGRLLARVLFRPVTVGPVDCPWQDPSCWAEPHPSGLQDITIQAGPPAFVEVIAPMDLEAGTPARVQVVVRDADYNPTRVSGTAQITAQGLPVGAPITLQDAFRGETTVVSKDPGFVRWSVEHPARAATIGHWSRVWPAGARTHERLVGDVHIHSGGSGNMSFLPAWSLSDHRGAFVRGQDTLRFLRDVSGYDFGALSEHAMPGDGFSIPPGASTAFAPGGPCEQQDVNLSEEALAWWTTSQQDAWEVEQASTDFLTFPAFEWHGSWHTPGLSAPLHRIVLYRDHDTAGPWQHPMLPGVTRGRPPHCLVHYLEASGQTPDDVLVMPHAMQPMDINLDWDLTFNPTNHGVDPLLDALVPGPRMHAWTRIGEIFSARAYGTGRDHTDMLRAFEGLAADPAQERWSFRYAWRDTEAVMGVIGASDSHSGMPGTNDTRTLAGTKSHRHDPTGAAFVVAPTDQPRRDAIFGAMLARHTYATSGVRAYADFHVDWQGPQPMGSEVGPVDACAIPASLLALMSTQVRLVEAWGVEVGGTRPYQLVGRDIGPNGEVWDRTFPLTNPLEPGDAPERWMYYASVMAGDAAPPGSTLSSLRNGHDDALWTSPIWVDWIAPPVACR